MSKRIFISRNLAADSIFKSRLEPLGYTIWDRSLLQFSAVTFSHLPDCDWIFFYSKNAVHFFFQQLEQLPNSIKYAAFGNGTALALQKLAIQPDFVGNGKKEDTAQAFASFVQGKKVLFPRAKQSQQSIQKLLPEGIKLVDLIVYNNEPLPKIDIPEVDFLVFTSPLNVQTYFSHYSLKKQQVVLAIGQTTANALTNLNISELKVAQHPTEAALVDLILEH